MACNDCLKLVPIIHDDNCRKVRPKIKRIKVACVDSLSIVYSSTIILDNGCGDVIFEDLEATGVVITDPLTCPLPIVDIVVENEDDIDELYTLALDDDDFATRNYVFNPRVKFYSAIQEAVLNSLEEQEVHVWYELEGLCDDNGNSTRYLKGKVRAVEGGIREGYELSIENEDPCDNERPKFFTAGIDSLDIFTQIPV